MKKTVDVGEIIAKIKQIVGQNEQKKIIITDKAMLLFCSIVCSIVYYRAVITSITS